MVTKIKKTQIVTKLKNSNCEKLKQSNCEKAKKKIVRKLKNCNWDGSYCEISDSSSFSDIF